MSKHTPPNEPTEGRVFVACKSNDKTIPVVAPTAAECAELATKQIDLPYSYHDISNWDSRHDWKAEQNGHRHWRMTISTHPQEYVSIHEVSVENGRLNTHDHSDNHN